MRTRYPANRRHAPGVSIDEVQMLAPAPPPQLRLIGEGACLPGDGRTLALECKDALVLAYFAIEGPSSRAALASMLWSDVEPERARANLRQRLFRLRKVVGFDLLEGHVVARLRADVRTDLDGPEAGTGELLTGVGEIDAGGLADWLDTTRARRRAAHCERLAGEAARLENAGSLAAALHVAQQLVDANPTSEHGHRRLMRLHYLRADRSAALVAYRHCAATLARELGAQPSDETRQLKLQIEKSTALALRVVPTPVWLLRPPRLIGRALELAQLVTALASGSHVLVLGDAGMGKSRLLEEYLLLQSVVAVQGRPGDEHSPYIVLARLLRALFAIGVQPNEAARAELARIVPECGQASTSKFDRGSFESAVEEMLASARATLAAVVVDDLHFADFASVELLARVGIGQGVPRLVFGARPGECEAVLALLDSTLVEARCLVRITLAALPLSAIEELLMSLELPPSPDTASAPLAVAIARHTGGNPQFILETLKALRGVDKRDLGANEHLPLPRSVGLLIERRLRQLSAPAIRLARVAAIAGSDFSAALAAAVLECGPVDLTDAWSELEAAAVLCDHRFAHDLVYETTLAGLPAAIARDMHGAVAQVLARTGGEVARIAEHWLSAGATDKALPLLLASARQAMEALCNHEAAQRFEKAIAIQAQAGDVGSEFDSLLDLFDCLQDLDRRAQVDAVLVRLFELAATPALQARALEARGRALLARLELDPALAAGTAALELATAANDPGTTFDTRLLITQTLAKLGRVEEAEAMLSAARAFAEGAASVHQRVYFYESAAFMMIAAERFEESHALWRKLEASAVEMKALRTVATSLNYQTLCEGNAGNFQQAAITAERWRDYVIDNGLFGEARQYLDLNLAYIYQNLGRYGDALAAIQRADALKVDHLGGLHVRYASAYALLGQFARVRQHLDAITANVPMTPGMRLTDMLLRLRLARVAGTRLPVGHGVDEVLQQAERVALASERAAPRVRWLLVRAEFLEANEAAQAARDAASLALAKGMHGDRICAEVLLARALLRLGDPPAALPRARIALALAASYQPEFLYFAEIGQVAHEVLTLNGENGGAILRSTVDWIQHTTAHHVPAEFRDSFMHRNPVNRDLLAAASRLGVRDALSQR